MKSASHCPASAVASPRATLPAMWNCPKATRRECECATSLQHPCTIPTHSVHTFRTANFSRGSIMIHEPSLPRPHPSTVTGNGRAWHCLHRRLHSRLPGLRQLRQPHQPGNTATAGRPLVTSQLVGAGNLVKKCKKHINESKTSRMNIILSS